MMLSLILILKMFHLVSLMFYLNLIEIPRRKNCKLITLRGILPILGWPTSLSGFLIGLSTFGCFVMNLGITKALHDVLVPWRFRTPMVGTFSSLY